MSCVCGSRIRIYCDRLNKEPVCTESGRIMTGSFFNIFLTATKFCVLVLFILQVKGLYFICLLFFFVYLSIPICLQNGLNDVFAVVPNCFVGLIGRFLNKFRRH